MNEKKDILWRIYLVYFITCFIAFAIVYKIFLIQIPEGEKWRAKAENFSTKLFSIEAVRGNIFDANGVLLATSLPYYEVGIDLQVEALTDKIFEDNVDSLAFSFSKLYPDVSQSRYKKMLVRARQDSTRRYLRLRRNVSYLELQQIKKFPIIRKGRNRGGFTYSQTYKREHPYKGLAARTIGKYNKEGTGKSYGLEIAYHNDLQGENGKRLMQKIAGGVWKPIEEDETLQLEDGADIVSTIDINIQDVASTSLMKSLKKYNASYGCLVLMEVATGHVKAIANLTKTKSGNYVDKLNYAVGRATVPGSTFKLMSLVAVMEDFGVTLEETVDVGKGFCFFSNIKVSDSHTPDNPVMTVKEIFEQSSNVGVTKLIHRYYSKKPQMFIDKLYTMNLNTPLGVSIPGEAKPYIKSTDDKSWSAISLPWMSYGYETDITPLQIVSFYNAIANNGKLVRPQFVKEIRRRDEVIKSFPTVTINPSICSQSTVEKARLMMEGVVENGTARSLKAANYKIAGKTGTAQMGRVDGKMTYQASFVGYFPADNPKYSCIVVVTAPSGDVYYGSAVAGPVFKDVADKVYATSLDIHEAVNSENTEVAKQSPSKKTAANIALRNVLNVLEIDTKKYDGYADSDWIRTSKINKHSTQISKATFEETLKKNVVPNLIGLTAPDALYLLESHGLRVEIIGKGSVRNQSLLAGSKFTKGTTITLELS